MTLKKKINKLKGVLGLSLSIAISEFKQRNEGSYLGILWYLLNPILMFGLLFLIFSQRLGENIPNYPIYLLLGIIMFNFFQHTTSFSITNIRGHRGIIKSIRFPKESLIISNLFRNIFSHFFEIIVLILMILIFGISMQNFIFYPIILIFYCFFIYGLSLILASLYVYFIDIENIWAFASRLIFFITPIFYSIQQNSKLFLLNLFNPIYYFITISRDILIYQKIPELWIIEIAIIYSLLFFIIGSLIFNKLKRNFAEFG